MRTETPDNQLAILHSLPVYSTNGNDRREPFQQQHNLPGPSDRLRSIQKSKEDDGF